MKFTTPQQVSPQQAHFIMRSPKLLIEKQHIGSAGTDVRMTFQLDRPVETTGGLRNGSTIECTRAEMAAYVRQMATELGLTVE